MSRPGTAPHEGGRLPPVAVCVAIAVLALLAVLLLAAVSPASPHAAPGAPLSGTSASVSPLPRQASPPASSSRTAPGGPTSLLASPELLSTVERTLAKASPYLFRATSQPTATSVNLSGFAIIAEGTSAFSNNGVEFISSIPQLPPGFGGGLSTSSVVIVVAGETVTTNVSAVVGFIELSDSGITGGLPIYAVNDSGVSTVGTASILSFMSVGSGPHTFAMTEVHGPWWDFTADGTLITGGPVSVGSPNGTANLKVSSASILTLSIPAFAYLIPANITTMPLSTIQTVLDVRSGTTWTDPTEGIEGLDENLGVAGYLQDSTIPPDEVKFGGNEPVLGALTTLWDTGALPTLSLAERGLNPSPGPVVSLVSGQALPITVWSNDSTTGAGVESSVLWNSSTLVPDPVETVSVGPDPGEFHLLYAAPAVAQATFDNVTLQVNSSGYVSARGTFPVEVRPAVLSIGSGLPERTLVSGASEVVDFWINASGLGPVTPASVVVNVSGGGTAVPEWNGGSPPGIFPVEFTAPLFMTDSNSTITLTASGPGLLPLQSHVAVAVLTRPLSLGSPPTGAAWAGASLVYGLTLFTPQGALPSTSGSWWNYTVRSGTGADALSGAATLTSDGGSAELVVPLSPGFVGPLWFWVNVTAAGFEIGGAQATWEVEVSGNLTVAITGLPATLHGGSTVTLTATVLGVISQPLADAAVQWSAVGGRFGGGGGTTATSYTDGAGQTSVSFHLVSVQSNTNVSVTATVDVPYYAPGSAGAWTTASPGAGALGISSQTLADADLLLVVLFLVVVLVVLTQLRNRAARAPKGPAAAAGAAGAGKWASEGEETPSAKGDEVAPTPPTEGEEEAPEGASSALSSSPPTGSEPALKGKGTEVELGEASSKAPQATPSDQGTAKAIGEERPQASPLSAPPAPVAAARETSGEGTASEAPVGKTTTGLPSSVPSSEKTAESRGVPSNSSEEDRSEGTSSAGPAPQEGSATVGKSETPSVPASDQGASGKSTGNVAPKSSGGRRRKGPKSS